MEIIYNYLKNAFLDIKDETKQNPPFVGVLLILVTIPASLAVNNAALILLVGAASLKFKKQNFQISNSIILLILLYILMLFSAFWTIDMEETLKGLPKELALLIIPTVFFFILNFTKSQKAKLLKYYSFGMVLWSFYWILHSVNQYLITENYAAFFYHELVTKEVNAIHVSIYVSIAFFYFFTKEKKSVASNLIALWLFFFIALLSSKNAILTVIFLILVYTFFYSKMIKKVKIYYLITLLATFCIAISFGKIRERFEMEIAENFTYTPGEAVKKRAGVNTVNIAEAWKKEKFDPSDYFPGTALRVYKFRMFVELFNEDPVFWKGYGLNASKVKLRQKAKEYNLYFGYKGFNFHNQYIQNFAELGFFGFLVLIMIVLINLKNSIKSEDFLHIAFAILMISLFLTESFLWRQRGVMFFTIMFCIFNATNHVKHTEIE